MFIKVMNLTQVFEGGETMFEEDKEIILNLDHIIWIREADDFEDVLEVCLSSTTAHEGPLYIGGYYAEFAAFLPAAAVKLDCYV